MQALLRLKLLQRSMAANVLSHQKSESSEVNRQVQPHGSSIMQLRFDNFHKEISITKLYQALPFITGLCFKNISSSALCDQDTQYLATFYYVICISSYT